MEITCKINNFTEKDLVDNDIAFYLIFKDDIESLNIKPVEELVKKLERIGTKARQKVLVLFDGYDDILDEVYEIMDIRKYMTKLIKIFPHLFYFISAFQNNASILAACISDVKKVSFVPHISPEELIKKGITSQVFPVNFMFKPPTDVSRKIIRETMLYAYSIGDAPEEVYKIFNGIFNER